MGNKKKMKYLNLLFITLILISFSLQTNLKAQSLETTEVETEEEEQTEFEDQEQIEEEEEDDAEGNLTPEMKKKLRKLEDLEYFTHRTCRDLKIKCPRRPANGDDLAGRIKTIRLAFEKFIEKLNYRTMFKPVDNLTNLEIIKDEISWKLRDLKRHH